MALFVYCVLILLTGAYLLPAESAPLFLCADAIAMGILLAVPQSWKVVRAIIFHTFVWANTLVSSAQVLLIALPPRTADGHPVMPIAQLFYALCLTTGMTVSVIILTRKISLTFGFVRNIELTIIIALLITYGLYSYC